MKITQLYTYPIKSLRSVPLTQTTLTTSGLPYDRRFLLLRVHSPNPSDAPPNPRSKSHYNPATGLENMTITYYPELALFLQAIDEAAGVLTVTYNPPDAGKRRRMKIPLQPETAGLERVEVNMHGSPTVAYKMGKGVNAFFSECLGCGEVLLAYLGPNRRKVLGNVAPNHVAADATMRGQSWLGSMAKGLPSMMGMGAKQDERKEEAEITFADIAAYLIVTEESLQDVSTRLPEGVEMDGTKFRPNIVAQGAGEAWEEDFWGGITIIGSRGVKSEIVLTSNCARCVSINVDYVTGQAGKGEEGSVLKKLMRDRRVDQGTKWSPVFGRYGFLSGEEREVRVGDEAVVSRWNGERTTFEWPGMGS